MWYISGSSRVHSHLSQSGFQWVAWKVALASLPFGSPRSFLVRKVLLTSRMRNMGSLFYFIWAGPIQPPLSTVLLIFWSFCPHGMNSTCLPPASSSINSLSSFCLGFLNFLGGFACLQMLVLVLSVILQLSFASWIFLFSNVCELGFIDMSRNSFSHILQ